ncbi:hypothetical protein O6H91_06G039300 [Diphasiastrum complanatum]|uniref:Uncharacterized protein n=1 Tax=Diphasiastrum complanatum TaxID=34168 RepID=A0ACC2DCK5_DIPCM|nr:hypothetical protein O6H91_06G039300 [Diphasiastrum complanatum]
MAMSQFTQATLLFTLFGMVAFILGILAENKKPTDDVIQLQQSNGVSICHYPRDSSPTLGSLAVVFLFISSSIAIVAMFYPYGGKSIPQSALWRNTLFMVFFSLSLALYFLAEALLLWAVIRQSMTRKHNIHPLSLDSCPSAKAGLFGGAAFLALDTTLFWLICMMLVSNARADHFQEGEDENGYYGKVVEDTTTTTTTTTTVDPKV